MDLKTLDYMKKRVGKSIEIITRIDSLTLAIKHAKKTYQVKLHSLDNNGGSQEIELVKRGESRTRSDDDYRTETMALMLNVFIDMTLAEIRKLEKALEEI